MIRRYTDKIQQVLKSKTKTEPWLHVVLQHQRDDVNSALAWAIYVWDTRQVIEEDFVTMTDEQIVSILRKCGIGTPRVKDNHRKLKNTKFIEIDEYTKRLL